MSGNLSKAALAGAIVCSLSGGAFAGTSETAQLRAELAALRAEMNQMRHGQDQQQLDQRRADEVRDLVREVLEDAGNRRSMLDEGLLAGIDDKGKIFLKSADENFSLNIDGQIQFRYIYNNNSGRAQESIDGFQTRRAKVGFNGHIGSPKIGYTLVIAHDRANGDLIWEEVALNYKLTDDLTLTAGSGIKLPFLREELMSSKRLLAVDRGLSTEFFTLNRAEQIQLQFNQDRYRLTGALSDGANESYNNPDRGDFALTGRAEFLAIGENWRQNRDMMAWDAETHLFIGAAAHYETGSTDTLAYTVDALFKSGNVAVLGAVMGAALENSTTGNDTDPFGVLLQAGLNVTKELQPFVRWDYVDDDTANEPLQAVTLGANYYLKGHSAKFTLDAVWIYAGDNPSINGSSLAGGQMSSGLGLSSSGHSDSDDQIAVRAQFQLLF